MRKGRDGGKKTGKKGGEKKRKKNNDGNSGHYVVASCSPERRPTATPPLVPNSNSKPFQADHFRP